MLLNSRCDGKLLRLKSTILEQVYTVCPVRFHGYLGRDYRTELQVVQWGSSIGPGLVKWAFPCINRPSPSFTMTKPTPPAKDRNLTLGQKALYVCRAVNYNNHVAIAKWASEIFKPRKSLNRSVSSNESTNFRINGTWTRYQTSTSLYQFYIRNSVKNLDHKYKAEKDPYIYRSY